jgi:hypothetical protein
MDDDEVREKSFFRPLPSKLEDDNEDRSFEYSSEDVFLPWIASN